jgi:hypothetical protein
LIKTVFSEVIPGASTPLTNSLMLHCLDLSIQKTMLHVPLNKQALCPYTRRMIPISHHHSFFNYLDCCLPQVKPKAGANPLKCQRTSISVFVKYK